MNPYDEIRNTVAANGPKAILVNIAEPGGEGKGEVTMSEPRPTDRLLRYFQYAHLPEHLQEASRPFCELAKKIANGGTMGPETTVALRKLLEAKDAYVRAHLNEVVGEADAT